VHELDNRGSHFYLTLYWATALANQQQDRELQAAFAPLAEALQANETAIVDELNAAQGVSMDLGGYYRPEINLASTAMRPSATFNRLLSTLDVPAT